MTYENIRILALWVSIASVLAFLVATALALRSREPQAEDGAGRGALLTGLATSMATAAILGGALWERSLEVGHAPFQTLYEVLLYGALCTALSLVAVVVTNRLHQGGVRRVAIGGGLGALSMALVALVVGPGHGYYGDDGLSLPPALQSVFFVPHVMVYLFGYGAAMVAAFAAVLQLVASWPSGPGSLVSEAAARELDRIAYRNVCLAFPFLSIGLGLGTAWAWYAWADYWSWDNKEVWALVSWLIFVVYLHLRRVRGWQGRPASWFVVGGGVAIVFTLLLFGYLPASHFSVHRYVG